MTAPRTQCHCATDSVNITKLQIAPQLSEVYNGCNLPPEIPGVGSGYEPGWSLSSRSKDAIALLSNVYSSVSSELNSSALGTSNNDAVHSATADAYISMQI